MQFGLVGGLLERSDHLMVILVLLDCLRCFHLALLFKLFDKLFAPFERCVLLGTLHFITVGVGKVVEAVGFVIVFLEFLEHAPLFHALLHILSVLLLHGCFLLDFNLVQLVNLLSNSLILQPLLLQIVHPLLSLGLCFRLRLLHVLLHVFSGVLIGGLVEEEGPLAPVQFLLQERLEGHLGQKFVILKRFHHFLLHLARV